MTEPAPDSADEECAHCGEIHDGECLTANDHWMALTSDEQDAYIRKGLIADLRQTIGETPTVDDSHDDGCCGGGVGPVPYPGCVDCPSPTQTTVARPLSEWNEDIHDVTWWVFPVEEAPWIGSPFDSDWPGYHTHWTPLPPIPQEPKSWPVNERIARMIAEAANPWSVNDIGPRSANDWTRHPDTDAKMRLWEVYLPLANKVIAEATST